MKVTFHFQDGSAEVFLIPETKRDEQYLELLRGCADMAVIGTTKEKALSILFKERKLES